MSKNSTSFLKLWQKFYKKNYYYHQDLEKLARHLIPPTVSVVQFSPKCGELLKTLPNSVKVGVEHYEDILKYLQKRKGKTKYVDIKNISRLGKASFDYVLFSHTFSDIDDVQSVLHKIHDFTHEDSKIIVFSFNYLWKPVLDIAEKLGLKIPTQKQPNWLTEYDIENLFYLENYIKIKSGKRFVFPYSFGFVSEFINRYISPLPIINSFALVSYSVYKPISNYRDYSVSIIIPARNEAGNMKGVLKKIPQLGKKTEIVFVEGHSKDDTYEVIKNEIKNYNGPLKCKLLKQTGKGKGDAVRLGFEKASNELLMILDADLTVRPTDLPKFYNAIAQDKGEFVMGSRLVYPMEDEAMRVLNYFGNKFFSLVFTFLLGQPIKDTLCGTKVLTKRNYEKIAENRKYFGDFDPFGDFDLIFGAAKLNLKITEIPVRYRERVYGTTNISRFTHGFLLLQMVLVAAKKIKFV